MALRKGPLLMLPNVGRSYCGRCSSQGTEITMPALGMKALQSSEAGVGWLEVPPDVPLEATALEAAGSTLADAASLSVVVFLATGGVLAT
jgi:hypothetical protein